MSHLERQSFLSIEGIGLEDMKDKYAGSVEFSSQWLQALEAPGPCNYMIRDGWLLYKNRLCVLRSHRPAVLHDAHDALTGGHRGMNATLEKIERHFFWPKMRKDVYNYVFDDCCQVQQILYANSVQDQCDGRRCYPVVC